MRTRNGLCYPKREDAAHVSGRHRRRKRPRAEYAAVAAAGKRRRRAAAASPADFVSALLTCKRFNELGMQRMVLSKASAKAVAVRAKDWSEPAHRFLKRCVDAGNLEACYMLGMIRFYCLENRGSGASLMARAAMGCHAAALYSLGVIQFNGSGGSKGDKDLRAGAALCARAAALGHVDALRELGHCLQDGYGVRRSLPDGRRLLLHANARELHLSLRSLPANHHGPHPHPHPHHHGQAPPRCCSLLSDFGCHVAAGEGHPANRFLVEWFGCGRGKRLAEEEGLRMCSHEGCGRPETRRAEFRRCSVCGAVNYCSRACQALHWKLAHKADCSPLDRWLLPDPNPPIIPAPPPRPCPAPEMV
ncbi:F-box protein At1g67340-like [Ananas comosus]|uniref:F-box protein At1g67340-like n=1 Tax=Ananas comosus TaxID=4615 RepID=A0A6P5GHL9_ANACO|nr:F-box protein At1g67340-like [Ananas comosus]